MKNKTIYAALGILVAYVSILLFISLGSRSKISGDDFMALMLAAVGLETCVLLLLGIVWYLPSIEGKETPQTKSKSKHFVLAAMMVLLIGFSVCVGGDAMLRH